LVRPEPTTDGRFRNAPILTIHTRYNQVHYADRTMKKKPTISPMDWAIVAAMLLIITAASRPTPVF